MTSRDMPPLLIDATPALHLGPTLPTGIPRVEMRLMAGLLAQRIRPVELFCYDPAIRACRLLTAGERIFVARVLKEAGQYTPAAATAFSFWQRLKRIVGLYRHNPHFVERESVYLMARFLAADGRPGTRFEIAKGLVRGVSAVHATARRLTRAVPEPGEFEALLANGASILFGMPATGSPIIGSRSWDALQGNINLFLHDTMPLDHPAYFNPRHPERFRTALVELLKASRRVVCNSVATRDRLLYWSGELGLAVEPEHCPVMPMSSPLDATPCRPVGRDWLREGGYAVFCSTIEPRKNHALLLAVWSRLLERWPAERVPDLVLVGRRGWQAEAVVTAIEEDPRLKAKVHLFHFAPDEELVWLYRHAAFSLFPSLAEGWGLGASESLSQGTPVLVSDIPSLSEATQGLMPVLPTDDPEPWVATIGGFIDDPARLAALRQAVAERFVEDKVEDVVEKLLASLE